MVVALAISHNNNDNLPKWHPRVSLPGHLSDWVKDNETPSIHSPADAGKPDRISGGTFVQRGAFYKAEAGTLQILLTTTQSLLLASKPILDECHRHEPQSRRLKIASKNVKIIGLRAMITKTGPGFKTPFMYICWDLNLQGPNKYKWRFQLTRGNTKWPPKSSTLSTHHLGILPTGRKRNALRTSSSYRLLQASKNPLDAFAFVPQYSRDIPWYWWSTSSASSRSPKRSLLSFLTCSWGGVFSIEP